MSKIYRYKIDNQQLLNHLKEFANIHKYDSREDYNTAWEQWCLCYSELIHTEETIMHRKGYTGCVKEKLFKAGKYYYCKKKKIPSDTAFFCLLSL